MSKYEDAPCHLKRIQLRYQKCSTIRLNDLCLDFEDTGNSMHYKVLFKASFKKIGINTVSLKEKNVLFLSFLFY